MKRRPAKQTGKLVPLATAKPVGGDLNPQAKIVQAQDDVLNLDDLTQEDKFYLIQQIESTMQKNARYNSRAQVYEDDGEDQEAGMLSPTAKARDSLEIIEDCGAAEDQEDDVPTKVEPKRGF